LAQVAEFVGRHPLALVVGEEHFLLRPGTPAKWVPETKANLLWRLTWKMSQGTAGAGQASVGIRSKRVDKAASAVAGQAIAVIVGVRDAVSKGDDPVQSPGQAIAAGIHNASQVASMQHVQGIVLGQHGIGFLEQTASIVVVAGRLAITSR